MNKMKTYIELIVNAVRYWRARIVFKKRYSKVLSLNGIGNKPVENENEWLQKWHRIDPHITALQYRVFSHYVGPNINIVPEETSHFKVEPLLNSKSMAAYYSDKNMFDKILPPPYLPKTILRKINGSFYDADFKFINLSNDVLNSILAQQTNEKCIVKPSVGGESGRGVQLFQRSGNEWRNIKTNCPLSVEWLTNNAGDNMIMQEAIIQHDYVNQFNDSSVNTLRLAVYRSVKDDKCHVLGAIMRIGAKGEVVDNAHQGGRFIGIKPNGNFCKFACNQYGQKFTSFNGLDFTKDFNYPCWDKVTEFGKEVCSYLIHNRLVALDIALNNEGKPKLIEYNITPGTYSMWLFQYTVGSAYGDYADEIIENCIRKKKYKHE